MTTVRVLVTRPQPGADRTADRLALSGHTPALLPVTEAVFDSEAFRGALDRRWSALALTSANAARALAGVAEAIAAWGDLPVYAVGRHTAQAAADAGFGRVVSADGDGGALAALVAGSSADAPVLYCAGDPRAPIFEERMAAAGTPFEAVTAYRMQPRKIRPDELESALLGLPFDATLFYSPATVEIFFRLVVRNGLTRRLQLGHILCLSDQVRAGLPEAFRAQAVAADTPSEDRILAMLAGMRG